MASSMVDFVASPLPARQMTLSPGSAQSSSRMPR
jgi:hypothetical protein